MIWDANSSSTAAVKSARLKSCTAVCQVCHEKMKSTPLSQVSIAANRSYFAWPQAHTIGNTLCRPLAHRCGNDVAAPVATAALLGLAQLDPSRMSTSMSIHVSSFFHNSLEDRILQLADNTFSLTVLTGLSYSPVCNSIRFLPSCT